ncbi:hypothetical protein Nepgr_013073 [Nepenthes gracilis]|uniref:Uncharacterized protein n=1 Tax=Nepenthes gracilis TaxID=150966 RepID=A0AAD3XNC0_NEPGR|nr:hypothetical protein Nepgr_013073 [Nepenthes gracilis]
MQAFQTQSDSNASFVIMHSLAFSTSLCPSSKGSRDTNEKSSSNTQEPMSEHQDQIKRSDKRHRSQKRGSEGTPGAGSLPHSAFTESHFRPQLHHYT